MSQERPVKKIYPSASALSSIQNDVCCIEDGCSQRFKSESNLTMHVKKFHKKEDLKKSKDDDYLMQFYCPESDCAYSKSKFFNKFKYLKQHFLKVHAEKSFVCMKCSKGFSTLSNMNSHLETCGITFTCPDCGNIYTGYESLLTHGKRKGHKIPDKKTYIKKDPQVPIATMIPEAQRFILPKQLGNIVNTPIILITNSNTAFRVDKESQTDICQMKKSKSAKRRLTQHTQTFCDKKKIRTNTETQTTGDYILNKAIKEANINDKVTIETQTKIHDWLKSDGRVITNNETQTGFYEEKNLVNELENVMNTTQTTQTNLNSLNFFEDSSFGNQQTQTELYQDDFLQSAVFTTHIETQTNENNDLDLCTNMYTQTCDDPLLSDFGFSNIQTQTTYDYDTFVSTETQTLLTQSSKSVFDLPMSSREISHMETQTDMEFKQLLEEINA